MNARITTVFYHPKNPLNVVDAARIAKTIGSTLYIVRRPRVEYRVESPEIKYVDSLEEVVDLYKSSSYFIVLETYGRVCLDEVEIDESYEHYVLVIGAEDYGVPYSEAAKLPPKRSIIARLPVRVEGASYNVAASLALGLYYLYKKLEGEGSKPVRSNNFIDFLFK